MTWPRAAGSTNGARSPAGAKKGRTTRPPAPGGDDASSASRSSRAAPVSASAHSREGVPTMAGITRIQRSGSGMQSSIPAGTSIGLHTIDQHGTAERGAEDDQAVAGIA